jgi:hypothetical protein
MENDSFHDIVCFGSKCVRNLDDKRAEQFSSGSHLRLWKDDKDRDLWIDRFDVRNELDNADMKQLEKGIVALSGPDEYMLDKEESDYFEDMMLERFQDILDCKEEDLMNLELLRPHHIEEEEEEEIVTQTNEVVEANDSKQQFSWGYQSTREEIWVRYETEKIYLILLILKIR